jgi:hypothetical protein
MYVSLFYVLFIFCVLCVRRAASLRQGVPAARAFYVFRHFRGAKLDIISDMCKLKRLFV